MYPKECRYSANASSNAVRMRIESAYDRYDQWKESSSDALIVIYQLSFIKGYLDYACDAAMEHNDYVLSKRIYTAYQVIDHMIENVMFGKEIFDVSERV